MHLSFRVFRLPPTEFCLFSTPYVCSRIFLPITWALALYQRCQALWGGPRVLASTTVSKIWPKAW